MVKYGIRFHKIPKFTVQRGMNMGEFLSLLFKFKAYSILKEATLVSNLSGLKKLKGYPTLQLQSLFFWHKSGIVSRITLTLASELHP
jgi:hypothetical protein